ncbi:MAG: DUF3301 domain-containing protein, partial [Leucothrix sp.]
MSSILVILFLIGLAWFWFDSARAKEAATTAAARACQDIQAQLLDQTVALKQLRLVRNISGKIQLQRSYNFELSMDREARSFGRVLLLAQQVSSV